VSGREIRRIVLRLLENAAKCVVVYCLDMKLEDSVVTLELNL